MPKYEVEITDNIVRSCIIVVEAPDPQAARLQVETIFNDAGPQSDQILDLLSERCDDIETTFATLGTVHPDTRPTLD